MTLTVIALFFTLYFARAILLPIALAGLLSLVLRPVVTRLRKLGVPNLLSAAMLFVLLTSAVTALAVSIWSPANEWLARAPNDFRRISSRLQTYSEPLEKLQEAKEGVEEMTAIPGEAKPVKVRVEQPRLASQVVNTTGGFATGVTITMSLLFFLLCSGDRLLEKVVEVVPTWRRKREVVQLFREIEGKMATYLGAITAINIGLGVVIGLGMWMIGMPNPLLWGVVAALLNYIPLAGLVVGSVLVFVVALIELPTLGQAALAPSIYLLANGIEANFITPAVLGKSISLNPVVILSMIFLGGWLWGIGGVFLAVPFLLVLKIACDSFDALQPVGVFLAR